MNNNKFLGIDMDVLGTWASLLCAVHCALTPLVVSYGLLGGLSIFENEIWDLALIGISAILALTSLVNGYRNQHKDMVPLMAAFLGFIIIAIGHVGTHSMMGHFITALGGILIAFAHIYNAALRKSFS